MPLETKELPLDLDHNCKMYSGGVIRPIHERACPACQYLRGYHDARKALLEWLRQGYNNNGFLPPGDDEQSFRVVTHYGYIHQELSKKVEP